jgi:WhiB family redox-sensing transcriptional regulator
MAWADGAACIGMDPDLFFPARGEELDPDVSAACSRCAVRGDCLEWALRHERHGYWAGTSERQRRRLRRSLGIRLAEDQPEAIDPDPSPTSEVSA